MLLTPEEIKQQTRELWRTCFQDSEEFMDIYFEDKYTDAANITCRPDGRVAAAAQILPYSMKFYGSVVHAGYVSGLATLPAYRGRGLAAQILREAHRRLYRQGAVLSFLIPGSEELRRFYEDPRHGAYWTSTYRAEVRLTADSPDDGKTEVSCPDDWSDDLYVFYRRHTVRTPFILHASRSDFFAALDLCDLEGGCVLTARRHRRMVGLCLAVPADGGSSRVRALCATGDHVLQAFARYLANRFGATSVCDLLAVPGSAAGAQPYAMSRVVHVEKFLRTVVLAHPGFRLHIGVDGDLDVPENNGYYLVQDGRVSVTDRRPANIVTPGGLAAMFLGAQPVQMRMMLDE